MKLDNLYDHYMKNYGLHPVHGVNPRYTHCRSCKTVKDKDIVFLGEYNTVVTCAACNTRLLRSTKGLNSPCDKCKATPTAEWSQRELEGNETVPARDLCYTCLCSKREKEHAAKLEAKKESELSITQFICTACGTTGQLPKNDQRAGDSTTIMLPSCSKCPQPTSVQDPKTEQP